METAPRDGTRILLWAEGMHVTLWEKVIGTDEWAG